MASLAPSSRHVLLQQLTWQLGEIYHMDCDSDDSDSGHLADADEGLGAKLQDLKLQEKSYSTCKREV